MKATISKETITQRPSLSLGALLKNKQTLPMLSNILIEFPDIALSRLVATDLGSELTIVGKTDDCVTRRDVTYRVQLKKLNDLCETNS